MITNSSSQTKWGWRRRRRRVGILVESGVTARGDSERCWKALGDRRDFGNVEPTMAPTSIPAFGACSRTSSMAPPRTIVASCSSCFDRRASTRVDPSASALDASRDAPWSRSAASSWFFCRKSASGCLAKAPSACRQALLAQSGYLLDGLFDKCLDDR